MNILPQPKEKRCRQIGILLPLEDLIFKMLVALEPVNQSNQSWVILLQV